MQKARDKEYELVNVEFIRRPDTYNIHIGGRQYGCPDRVLVKDLISGKCCMIFKNDPRYYKELIPFCFGLSLVKDHDGKVIRIPKTDIRVTSGELKGHLNGYKFKPAIAKIKDVTNPFYGKHHTEEHKKYIGQINSIKQKGESNSQYGTCWIYNLELKENKKIKKDQLEEYLNSGWIKGRKYF